MITIKWGRQQERLIDREELDLPSRSSLLLKDIIGRYEREILPKKKSKSGTFHLRQILRHRIASTNVCQLTAENIVDYREHRLKSVSGATVRKEMSLLGTVLKHAAIEWSVSINAKSLTSIRKPPSAKGRERRLNQEEEKNLIGIFRKSRNKSCLKIFEIALETGMRRGEILSLKRKYINFDSKTVFLPITKNGEKRTVPLSTNAVQVLREFESIPEEDLLFPLTENALRLAWNRATKKAGINDLRFHDLRHEAISRFFEMGLSVPEVALISGHKDARMLFRYTHLKAEDVANKLQKVSAPN